jgi:hypothetical protein
VTQNQPDEQLVKVRLDEGGKEEAGAALELLLDRMRRRDLRTGELVDQLLERRPKLWLKAIGTVLGCSAALAATTSLFAHPAVAAITLFGGIGLWSNALARLILMDLQGEKLSPSETFRAWLLATLPFLFQSLLFLGMALFVLPFTTWWLGRLLGLGFTGALGCALGTALAFAALTGSWNSSQIRTYLFAGCALPESIPGDRSLTSWDVLRSQGVGTLEAVRFSLLAALFFTLTAIIDQTFQSFVANLSPWIYLVPLACVFPSGMRLLVIWSLEILWAYLPGHERQGRSRLPAGDSVN